MSLTRAVIIVARTHAQCAQIEFSSKSTMFDKDCVSFNNLHLFTLVSTCVYNFLRQFVFASLVVLGIAN